jgi:hypothetical protein
MDKRKRSKKAKRGSKKTGGSLKDVLSLYAKIADIKKEMVQVEEGGERAEDRLIDLEVHVNLLARLLTTLCLEKLGIRADALKRLVRRVEKEALRDSQIMELESLYKLSNGNPRKAPPARSRTRDDPWEQIS